MNEPASVARRGCPAGSYLADAAAAADLKFVNLALQGGGAHGAFAWGVLDRLLEDGRLGVEGISATSAGARSAMAAGTSAALIAPSIASAES